MIRRSRTSIAKVLRMSAGETVLLLGIVEIAVAEEDVRAAEAVVVVVGAAVAVEAVVVVMAVGMAVTAAEGIKPRIINLRNSKFPPLRLRSGQAWRTERDKGGAPRYGELRA